MRISIKECTAAHIFINTMVLRYFIIFNNQIAGFKDENFSNKSKSIKLSALTFTRKSCINQTFLRVLLIRCYHRFAMQIVAEMVAHLVA